MLGRIRRGRARRALRHDPLAQRRHARPRVAHRLADSRRRRHDHRRVENRAGTSPAGNRSKHELHDLQHRLMGLAAASASILGSPDVDAVLSATIDLARDVFAADGYALWRADKHGMWKIVRSFGISEEFSARIIAAADGERQRGGRRVPFSEPLIVEDVGDDADGRRHARRVRAGRHRVDDRVPAARSAASDAARWCSTRGVRASSATSTCRSAPRSRISPRPR